MHVGRILHRKLVGIKYAASAHAGVDAFNLTILAAQNERVLACPEASHVLCIRLSAMDVHVFACMRANL